MGKRTAKQKVYFVRFGWNTAIRLLGTGLVAIFAFAATASGKSLEKWFLMSRHGECAQIATLQRKVSDLPAIEDPVSFSRYMRARGYTVIEQDLELPGVGAIQIEVVELSLNPIFVTEPVCNNYLEHE